MIIKHPPTVRISLASRRTVAAVALAAIALQGCGDDDGDYDYQGSRSAFEQAQAEAVAAASAPQTVFDPQNAELPFPIDLLFSGSEDGTLNIPVDSDADGVPLNPADPVITLNQMDGFSTVAPISASASEALDVATLAAGVRVFEVDSLQNGAVTGVVRELGEQEISVQGVGSQVVILPITPLAAKTRYLVVLTNDIIGADGNALEPSLFYRLAKKSPDCDEVAEDMRPECEAAPLYTSGLAAFEPVRQLTQSHLGAAASQGIDPANVVLSWTFLTQSIREPLQAVEDVVTPRALMLAPATGADGETLTTADANENLPGTADIWVGTLDLPYYLSAADPADQASVSAALNSVWRNADGNPVGPLDWIPVQTSLQTVPVLMSVPNTGEAPESGWPVTLFQHGITGDRSNMLAIADSMAAAGRVVIAIDLPMHGVTASDPVADGPLAALNAANTPFAETERHFNIDVIDNESRAPGADGRIDPSGTQFNNLRNIGNSRDNLRQAVADLFTLSASVDGAVVPDGMGGAVAAAAAGIPLNVGDTNFIGHSLGGIVGATMLSFDDSFQSASLAMPGGGIAQLLANSVNFGPIVNGGLAAAGIETGSADYNRFLIATQTAVDSGDPINHAAVLGADMSTGLHMLMVEGDESVPNSVPSAPLSGTLPLARVMGLPQIDETTVTNRALVRFSVGDHISILRPSEGEQGPAATLEMQREVAQFAASLGQQVQINDTSVIEPIGAQ